MNNVFLHGFLKDDIYMLPPPGYTRAAPGQVCKLVKSLYGLKQASWEWNMEFCKQLLAHGFQQSHFDPYLFTRGSGSHFICLLVYVDDVFLSSPSQHIIDEVRDFLHSTFTIKDLGAAKFFLGIEIACSSEGTVLSQRKYVLDILTHTGMIGSRAASTPLPLGLVLSNSIEDRLEDPEPYRKLVGQLVYLNLTRPDITYATKQLSQFVSKPTKAHWNAAQHVLRYLKGYPSLGVYIAASNNCHLTAYSDADWGTCIDSQQSLIGHCIFFETTLLSWKCKKQQTVSVSTAESEYQAPSSTFRELLWLTYLLPEFGIPLSLSVPLYCETMHPFISLRITYFMSIPNTWTSTVILSVRSIRLD